MLARTTRARGTALIVTMIAVMIIAGITAALFELTMISSRAVQAEQDQLRAFQMAEGAMDRARAVMVGSGANNGAAVVALVQSAGTSSTSVEWDTTTNSWTTFQGGAWSATSHDVGLDGVANTNDQGEGDGFPTVGSMTDSTKPGEPNVQMFRFATSANDPHYYMVRAYYWGDDGIDNNNDGVDDGFGAGTDPFEDRTYMLRSTGVFNGVVVELETLITRDPPTPGIDPNNPPAGFLSALSVQIAGNSGTPAGNIEFKNTSNANDINGDDHQSTISGAPTSTTSNDTDGIQLAASGNAAGNLTMSADNPNRVTGNGGQTANNAMTTNGTFIGDVIDTIADGARNVAVDTSGLASDDATNQDWGSASDLKVVYHDADANGALAVQNPGFGILVIDVDDVTTAPVLTFSGNGSTWEGIVIVRAKNNLAPNTANGVIKMTGQGGGAGLMGSVVVYGKGAADFTSSKPYVVKNNGNRQTNFSRGAVQMALEAFNNMVPPTSDSEVSDPLLWRPIRQPGMAFGK